MLDPLAEFAFRVQTLKNALLLMNDEDARTAVGMLVSLSFQNTGGMTKETTELVEEYKRLKPHLAQAMDTFVASGATAEL